MPFGAILFAEPLRIKVVGVGEMLWVCVDAGGVDPDVTALRDCHLAPRYFVVSSGNSLQHRQGCVHPQSLRENLKYRVRNLRLVGCA